ncbi:MAG TPA: hypothetical protein VI894_00325 [Candidatus Nanoarchaeia archaeon]|nr:hypothetical protein [Candidatus Nanoarchaeia archaeon]
MVILINSLDKTENIEEIIFATKQQAIVARILIQKMKDSNGSFDKTEMALFANRLHTGEMVMEHKCRGFVVNKVNVSYNKRQFYERILSPMKIMGLIEYDDNRKIYILSDQFSRLLSIIGTKWHDEIKEALVETRTRVAMPNSIASVHSNRFPQPIFSN